MHINYSRCFPLTSFFPPHLPLPLPSPPARLHLSHVLLLFICSHSGFLFLYASLALLSSPPCFCFHRVCSFPPPLSALPPPVGPGGVQAGPLPGSSLGKLPGVERLGGGVHQPQPPAGQRHRRRHHLRLSQAAPERRLPHGRDSGGGGSGPPPRQPGDHRGPPG